MIVWAMIWASIGLICLGATGLTNMSLANSKTISVLYCADMSKQLDLSKAKDCPYVPYDQLILSTRQPNAIWAKLTIDDRSTASPVGVFVSPHLISSIEIFDGQTDRLLIGPIGTAYPFSEAHGLAGGYRFVLESASRDTKTYYFRMVAQGLPYAIVQASPLDQTAFEHISQQMGLGLHLGVLSLLFIGSTIGWLVIRDRVIGCFALVILNLLFSTLAGSGLLFEHLWPDWPQLNAPFFNAMFYLRVAFWVMLAQAFLATYQPPSWYRLGCLLAYLLVGLMLLLSWFGHSQISNWLLLIFGVTLIPIFQIIAIARTRNIRVFYRRIWVAGYAAGALLVWLTLLITVFPSNDPRLPIQFARMVDYVNPLILLALVVFHYRETALQLAQTKRENLSIRAGLELEQRLREERKLMVDMLTHELKNPLASISLAIGSLARTFTPTDNLSIRRLKNIDQSVRSMDLVIERCNLMNQLDQNSLACSPQNINLEELLTNAIERFPDGSRVRLTVAADSDS